MVDTKKPGFTTSPVTQRNIFLASNLFLAKDCVELNSELVRDIRARWLSIAAFAVAGGHFFCLLDVLNANQGEEK
ncbi:hypothetical protein [Paracoccus thiocyanatus]|uniref:hypothetical protein n=1 Tax=Paracoccus thiocyanatus TaxID=34006 RepID=UPI00122C5890|nr:hypothetical protein [Paracoccus thiocyanatus]